MTSKACRICDNIKQFLKDSDAQTNASLLSVYDIIKKLLLAPTETRQVMGEINRIDFSMTSSTTIEIINYMGNWLLTYWIELSISFALGITISICFDFRKYVVNFISNRRITQIIKESYNQKKINKKSFFNLFFHITVSLFNKTSATKQPTIDAKPEMSVLSKELLNPTEKMVCERISNIIKERTPNIFDIKPHYEKLVRLKNSNMATAACQAFQLFNQIAKLIEPIDICLREGEIKVKVGVFITVVNGLDKKTQEKTSDVDLCRQINDCESALVNVVNKLPLV